MKSVSVRLDGKPVDADEAFALAAVADAIGDVVPNFRCVDCGRAVLVRRDGARMLVHAEPSPDCPAK